MSPDPASWLRAEKIQARHLERLAVVYVRQSSLQQVLSHQESTRLQYGLVDQAVALGWSKARVLVIDDDLGKSASSAEGRPGFQRLVAEVSLDHVGLILGIEMSRLARSNKDWHQLLEVCALCNTLIADSNGVYDASQYSDRLLLGLGGIMSEAEVHLLKQRMVQGKLNKARRGELITTVPTGYIKRPSGEVVFDPDEQVQAVVRLIFGKFEELGTLHAVLRYLVRHDIQLGVRERSGAAKGELSWRRPNRQTLQNLLKNPIYAGAYAYGRKQVNPRKKQAGRPFTGMVVTPPEQWHAFFKDRFPAYISWQQYQRNLARLKANQTRAEEVGTARQGAALLAGLLRCGKCGSRLTVRYSGHKQLASYNCLQEASSYGGAFCQHIAGRAVDTFVSQQVLAALEPAALELSLEAAAHLEQERRELNSLWLQRLERASYETQRAAKHYQLVEPENRLVARVLAKQWEEKLTAEQRLQEDYQRFVHTSPQLLSVAEREAIRQLAHNLPALWQAPGTGPLERKEIIRQVIERVTVEVQGESEQVLLTIDWAGGKQSCGRMIRPVAKFTQLSYYPELCQRITTLAAEGLAAEHIATQLNKEGYRPPKRSERFARDAVLTLMRRLDLRPARSRSKQREGLGDHEWWLAALARQLDMPGVTLYNWIKRGWVSARQEQNAKRWIIWADDAEIARLKKRHQRPAGYYTRRRWVGEQSADAELQP